MTYTIARTDIERERLSADTLQHKGVVDASAFREMLAAISPFASTDRTIPMLNAVKLEAGDGKLSAAATDRYSLGSMTVDYSGDPFHALISLADVKTLLKTMDGIGDVTLLVTGESYYTRLTIEHSRGFMKTDQLDPDFPKWRSLLPNPENPGPTQAIGLNPHQLAKFAKVAAKNEPMRLTLFGPTKSVLVHIGDRFTGLIMPMKVAT